MCSRQAIRHGSPKNRKAAERPIGPGHIGACCPELTMSKLAIIQRPAAVLNREAAIAAAVAAIAEASAQSARLVVFPEASIPGYPAWIWRLRPGTDSGLSARLHGLLLDQGVIIRRGDLRPLTEAARTHGVTVVCGANERDDEHGGGTIYNTVIVIGPDGSILNRHRKIMPTNPERMVWGFGDGSGLKVVDTPAGRLGTLICWENYMPLARYALYAQGIEIYVAPTYDNGDGWIGSLQHIAIEGACWVIGSGCVLRTAWGRFSQQLSRADRVVPRAERMGQRRGLGRDCPRRQDYRRPATARGRHPVRRIRSGARRYGAAQPRHCWPLQPTRHLSVACQQPGSIFSEVSMRWPWLAQKQPRAATSHQGATTLAPRGLRFRER